MTHSRLRRNNVYVPSYLQKSLSFGTLCRRRCTGCQAHPREGVPVSVFIVAAAGLTRGFTPAETLALVVRRARATRTSRTSMRRIVTPLNLRCYIVLFLPFALYPLHLLNWYSG